MLKVFKIVFNNIITIIYADYITEIDIELINKLQQIYKIIKKYYNKYYFNEEFLKKKHYYTRIY